MTVADRVKIQREKLGWSQQELADRMGLVNRSSVSQIEKSGNDITLNNIERLSEALMCSIPYLMGYSENSDSMTQIPILGRVAAGKPIIANEYIEGYEEIPNRLAQTGDYFALRIHGDSMSPKIEDGDIVIVKQTDTSENDKIIIALVDGNENAVCKRLKTYKDSLALVSINPNYEPMIFSKSNQCKVIGEVIQIRRTL